MKRTFNPSTFREEILFFLKILLFWMVFFLGERILFIAYNLPSQGSLTIGEFFAILYHGLRLDLSTACYLLLPPFLYWCARLFFLPKKTGLLKWYFSIAIPVFSLLVVVNLELYRDWGEKINASALSYLHYPAEAWASMSSSPLWILILIFLVVVSGGLSTALYLTRGLDRFSGVEDPLSVKAIIKCLVKIALVFAMLVLGLRGGTQLAPVNQSFAYFSARPFLNDAAVNTLWNLVYSLTKVQKGNPYSFYDLATAESKLDSLYSTGTEGSVPRLLTEERPNIILVILEGWTADLLFAFEENVELTPHMNSIIKNGLYFDRFYANGNRTDRGLVAILSGFPSQPRTSIIKEPQKTHSLPSLPRILKETGYNTYFYYGGETEFANIKSYLLQCQYDRIVGKSFFRKEEMNSKWGAHDHVVFKRVLADLKEILSPYFITILTLSSHEPFEVPMKRVISGKDRLSLYKNSIVYADRSISAFVDTISQRSGYENTLLVFMSDHGFRLIPGPYSQRMPARYHIPLVFYGPVLRREWRGKRISKIGSQTDFATTLLDQLGVYTSAFRYGKDVLRSGTPGFAFYTFNEGFGWVSPEMTLLYDHRNKKSTVLSSPSPSKHIGTVDSIGKAYLQVLFQDYLKR